MPKKSTCTTAAVPLKLQGKSVCLAGSFYGQDGDIRKLIEAEGGTIIPEVTDKTDFVVLAHTGVANVQKKVAKLNAQGAAIQALPPDQFEQALKPTPDEVVLLLRSGPDGIERWNRHCRQARRFIGLARQLRGSGQSPYVRGADFSNVDLTGAYLGDLMDHCDFSGANLTRCSLNLSNCNLNHAIVDGIVVLHLVDCSAEKVDFSRIGANADFQNCNLAGARFNGEKKALAFVKCRLDGMDAAGLQSPRASFQDCSLQHANFSGAILEEADFTKADLTAANFTNANVSLAKFTGAKVDGADFTGATLIGADVAGVDFSKAKGFEPSQVQTQGGPGKAVSDFIQTAAQAQRVSTTLAVSRGTQSAVLTVDLYPRWAQCYDTAGGRYYVAQQHTQKANADAWSTLTTKWHGASPDLSSLTVRATKAPMPNKELRQLALQAWCELFGMEPPSEEDLRKVVCSAKAQKKEKADKWLDLLRSGKKGVAQWNDNVAALRTMLESISDVDLSHAKLGGLQLGGMEWKKANLSGADLANAEIHHCRFAESNCAGVSLKSAKVRASSFNGANLKSADLTNATFWGSSLKQADCSEAKLEKADLRAVDLCGTNLTGATLKDANLEQATYDENTRWPKGFSPTLEMIWKGPGTSPAAHKLVQSTKPKGKLDVEQFMKRLEELTDAAKLGKALCMLKADRFRLYAQVQEDHFVGVVKSQSDGDLVYSCRLNADGTYACCTQNLNVCGGLRGSLCKHLLVLIVGLTKNGELDPNAIDTWIRLSKTNKPALDKDAMSETFLRYKGAEAGEVDWRPTETIPEDYYAM